MMHQRGFSGETDKQMMIALARAFPSGNLHVVDLPYRLSSWAMDYPDNIGLWEAEGQLMGWAVMQTPWWAIDCVFHPGAEQNLLRQILSWADERARQIIAAPSGRPCWFVNVFASQTNRLSELEEMGFVSQANVGENSWSKVFLQRSAQTPVASYTLPTGFSIRPLAGASEVEAYVRLQRAVFETETMTTEWRARTLRCPEYHADLDLVAVAPDGRLAAFCVCWCDRDADGKRTGQIEPLGVHKDFRQLGLGRAILLEGLRRLYACGADTVCVETDNYRDAALELYEGVGFSLAQDVLVYRKDYDEGHR